MENKVEYTTSVDPATHKITVTIPQMDVVLTLDGRTIRGSNIPKPDAQKPK